jgi:antitoxin component YwqK of YwqJK toxin-antitoxin module
MGEWYYTLDEVPYTGCAFQLYPGGALAGELNLVEGYREGAKREWFEDGRLRLDATFVNDMAQGDWRSWYKSGGLEFEGVFEKGRSVWYRKYNENGVLIDEYRA